MKFLEAKEKLKVLAEGRYHSMGFELTEYASGRQVTECRVFIDKRIGSISAGYGSTWEGAFAELCKDLGIQGGTEESPEV